MGRCRPARLRHGTAGTGSCGCERCALTAGRRSEQLRCDLQEVSPLFHPDATSRRSSLPVLVEALSTIFRNMREQLGKPALLLRYGDRTI